MPKEWEGLSILGRPKRDASRFFINFFNNKNDILLQFNPRFDENVCLFYKLLNI